MVLHKKRPTLVWKEKNKTSGTFGRSRESIRSYNSDMELHDDKSKENIGDGLKRTRCLLGLTNPKVSKVDSNFHDGMCMSQLKLFIQVRSKHVNNAEIFLNRLFEFLYYARDVKVLIKALKTLTYLRFNCIAYSLHRILVYFSKASETSPNSNFGR